MNRRSNFTFHRTRSNFPPLQTILQFFYIEETTDCKIIRTDSSFWKDRTFVSILWIIVQEMHRRLIKWNFKCASIKHVFLLKDLWNVFEKRTVCAVPRQDRARSRPAITVRLSAMKHGLSSSMRLLRAGCIAGDARERWLERGVFLPRDNFEMLSDCSQAGQLDLSNIDPG